MTYHIATPAETIASVFTNNAPMVIGLAVLACIILSTLTRKR